LIFLFCIAASEQPCFFREVPVSISLVTGGGGFIGSHVVEGLLAQGKRVRVLDDFSTGNRDNLRGCQNQVEVVAGSVTDAKLLATAMREVDHVYHLAALPSVQRSIEEPAATHEVCATGTIRLLEAAKDARVQRVVYAASSSAYGDTPGAIRTEDDPIAPMSPYAAAKLAGEFYCKAFTTSFGLETVRLRFFNIFGPRQSASSPYSGVIALFIAAMNDGRTPRVYGDGLQSRDFTYVTNAVQAVLKAAEAPGVAGRVYNIGQGGSVNLLQLVEHLNQLLGSRIVPQHGPARVGDVRHSQADITRARRDLGYDPQVSFIEGLRLTLESHRQVLSAREG
jgi:UDP-glucose 4-epimerase